MSMTLEHEEIQRVIKGSTKRQQKWIIQNLSTDMLEEELNRRNIETVNVMNAILEVFSKVSEDMTYNEMRSFIDELQNTVLHRPKREVKDEQTNEILQQSAGEGSSKSSEGQADSEQRGDTVLEGRCEDRELAAGVQNNNDGEEVVCSEEGMASQE